MSSYSPGSITVLVVEDSPIVSEFLCAVLCSDPAIRIVGVARDGREAMEAAERLRPSVITMDVHMPHMDGFAASRRIMERCPTPIVMVSGSEQAGAEDQHPHAVAAGALAIVPKPSGLGHRDHAESARQLIEMVKLMSEVKLVRRWPRAAQAQLPVPTAELPAEQKPRRPVRLIAIGASTGGPQVLQTILCELPRPLPVPILIVQHMSPGFVGSFCQWLEQSSGFPVRIAADRETVQPDHAYVAPDGMHMGLGSDGRIVLSKKAPENGVRPAVSFLFRSLDTALAPNVAAVLLTGMGRDGVDELKRLKQAGALTIAQDEESSVVFGMPGQAIQAGAVSHVLSPRGIAGKLATVVDHP